MLEKIEITQRFNFKKLNKHYECFIIDFISKKAYFNINEMIYPEQFYEGNYSLENPCDQILDDLKSRVLSKIYDLDETDCELFKIEFEKLNLFEGFKSQGFQYFEKLENLYSCNINLYYSDDYQEFSIKNDFPKYWLDFNDLLIKLVNFDVLNILNLENIVTNLFFNIKKEGVYDNEDNRLDLTSLEFGHYEAFPNDTPHPSVIIDFENKKISGYFEKENADFTVLFDLFEEYGVYEWILDSYQNKSNNYDSPELDGYDWYLELVFNSSIIWNIIGHNEYPDTYVFLAREIRQLTDLDLLEMETIPDEEIELFNHYGKMKLS